MFWRIVGLSIVALWVLTGAVFYYLIDNCRTVDGQEVCGWTFAESFYYSVQCGLSIGFGLLSETKEASRFYSIIHILAGSSVIAGCLSWFASRTLERHMKSLNDHESKLARFAHACHTDGYEGFNMLEMRDLLVKYPQFMADFVYKIEQDHDKVTEIMEKFETAPKGARETLAIQTLQRVHQEHGIFKGHGVNIDDIMKIHEESRTILRYVRSFVIQNSSLLMVWGFWLFWILLGAVFASFTCEWSFIKGLYFAVAALSTAGLQSVCEGETPVIFTAFYCLVGVPAFGVALGTCAGVIVDRSAAKQNEEKMHMKITETELSFAQHVLNHPPDAKIALSDYIEIQLLRTGAVDRETLESLKEEFEKLDENKDGFLTRDVAMKGHEHKVMKHKPKVTEASV